MKAVRMYAQVLLDVLTAPNSKFSMEMVLKELDGFSKLVTEAPLMLRVFDNPTVGEDEKQKTLKTFSQKLSFSPLTEKFISLLIKRNRLGILSAILDQVEVIQVEKNDGLIGELVSAVPLDAGAVTEISRAISKKMNKTVRLKVKVDPDLIAGLRVTVGGKTFDGSIRTRLNHVKDSFQ